MKSPNLFQPLQKYFVSQLQLSITIQNRPQGLSLPYVIAVGELLEVIKKRSLTVNTCHLLGNCNSLVVIGEIGNIPTEQ